MTPIEDLWPLYPRLVPIPEIFHSLEHDGPFRTCLQCEADLHQTHRYLIERVFKGHEPIVEYAMCSSCVEASSAELSAESLEMVRQYFLENADLQSRVDRFRPLAEEDDVAPWLSECLFTGTAADDCQERQLCGWFEGDRLRLEFAPFMLSGKAVEAIAEQLSEQTRGWMEDFVGDNFSLPSEFCDDPSLMPLLI